MKNLVYFASGLYKEDYQNLPYDNIYLIDSRFRFNTNQQIKGKVTCLKMDALEAANYLIDRKIFIDCYLIYTSSCLYILNHFFRFKKNNCIFL